MIDLTDRVFGNLTVLYKSSEKRDGEIMWHCFCACGNEVNVRGRSLRNGDTKSCGCFKASVYENEVANKLKTRNITFVREATFNDLKGLGNKHLKVDFILLDSLQSPVAAIEINGKQHYAAKENSWGYYQRTISDPIKRRYFQDKNIPLFEIKTTENIEEKIDEISSYYFSITSTPCQASNQDEGVTTILKQEYTSSEILEVEVPCVRKKDDDIV